MSRRTRACQPIVAGLVSGAVCFGLTKLFGIGAADFGWSLRAARDVLAGRDPYSYPTGPYAIPYPLPAAFVGLPFSIFPDSFAGALYIAVSVALLVCGFLRNEESWRMGMLFSWPFLYSLLFVQWSPLLCALWFFPGAAALVLAKPNIALPLLITQPAILKSALRSIGAISIVVVFGLSLLIYPSWPVVWLLSVASYQGSRPPLFVLPFGPLLLLSLIRWRERRAWLLFTMALMPQRVFYDQLPLLLVAGTKTELFPLVVCSWIGFFALWMSDNMGSMPGSWQLWVIVSSYLPALAVLLRPALSDLKRRLLSRDVPDLRVNRSGVICRREENLSATLAGGDGDHLP